MHKGVPFDVAFSIDSITRVAWSVILGEHEGGEFDWSRMAWRDASERRKR